MSNIWLIYPNTNAPSNAFGMFEEAAKKLCVSLRLVDARSIGIDTLRNSITIDRIPQEIPSVAIVRLYDSILSTFLQQVGCHVINSTESMSLALDKMQTHLRLRQHNIVSIPTLYHSNNNYRYNHLQALFHQDTFVLKQNTGCKGSGVFKVCNQTQLEEVIGQNTSPMIIQPFIRESSGRDIRIWVIGQTIVGAVERCNTSDFRSNLSQGGTATLLTPTPQAQAMALAATECIGLSFAGVDLLETNNGYCVCEINGNAGFRSITALDPHINIPLLILEYARQFLSYK